MSGWVDVGTDGYSNEQRGMEWLADWGEGGIDGRMDGWVFVQKAERVDE